MSEVVDPGNIRLEITPRKLSEFSDVFIGADIGQITTNKPIDTITLTASDINKYYYAVTNDGQLFIVYIIFKDENDIIYKKLYTRVDRLDPRNNDNIQAGIYTWLKYSADVPIKIRHGNLLRKNLKFYEIPIDQDGIEAPRFKYGGGKHKSRRVRRSRRSGRIEKRGAKKVIVGLKMLW